MKPDPHELEELVRRAQAGDGAAWGELYRRFHTRIYALALHVSGSRAEAEDITQDTFLRAWRRLDTFAHRSELFTWLYRIALNRALNVRRDGARRRTSSLEDPRVEVAVARDAYGDPARAAELRQRYRLLVVALDRLSESLRSAVVLVTLQGLSHDEAAVVLGCSPGTIGWRIHEARVRLRASLDGESPVRKRGAALRMRLLPEPAN